MDQLPIIRTIPLIAIKYPRLHAVMETIRRDHEGRSTLCCAEVPIHSRIRGRLDPVRQLNIDVP